MTADPPLDSDQRDRVLAQLSDRSPSLRLLGQLVIAHSVPLSQALGASVGDLDLAARSLTLADKRGQARTVSLDDRDIELAAATAAERGTAEALLVGRHGQPLSAEQARGALLGAARRAGVDITLAQLRSQALIAA